MIQRLVQVIEGSKGEDWLEISNAQAVFAAVCMVVLSVLYVVQFNL